MYGVINKSLKDMIIEQFGVERWTSILSRSGIPADSFLSLRSYDDERTYALAQACADELQIPLGAALKSFGEHWVKRTLDNEYSALVNSAGAHLVEFLQNLNALHDKMASTFADYQPPSFDVESLPGSMISIMYTSQRQGLTAFVEGLLLALARRFNQGMDIVGIEPQKVQFGEQTRFMLRLH